MLAGRNAGRNPSFDPIRTMETHNKQHQLKSRLDCLESLHRNPDPDSQTEAGTGDRTSIADLSLSLVPWKCLKPSVCFPGLLGDRAQELSQSCGGGKCFL